MRENAPLHKLIFRLFQHLRICNPFYAKRRSKAGQFTATKLNDTLNALVAVNYVRTPQFNYTNTMLPLKSDLLKELTSYILATEPTWSTRYSSWKVRSNWKDGLFSSWRLLNKQIMPSQPSSTVVERIFSAFKSIMHQNMSGALDDYVKSSLFSACN